jgi:hypothetical protein
MSAKLPKIAEDSPELIRAFPGDGERADTTATHTADCALVWVVGDEVPLLDLGEDLGQHELRVRAAQRVVFDTTVLGLRVPAELRREFRTEDAGERLPIVESYLLACAAFLRPAAVSNVAGPTAQTSASA